ncbi:MAG: DsrE/DsrF/DrsH-like family protein [Deltaproteobacteria bacterium]|nr:DsrE/DsrF/DrsH-like family protein [Deltaproteobacteria bacterium]
MSDKPKKIVMVASRGELDWAYPPFIIGSTAAALGWEVVIFFTFYGLTLLKKDINAKVNPAANAAMPMKMPVGPGFFQNINWPMPNLLTANMPGFENFATTLMKKTFKNKGVASVEELREICVESGVKMIGCQMTMDVFGFSKDEFISGVEIGGAAMMLQEAGDSDVQFFM